MKNKILTLVMLSSLFLISCKESQKQETTGKTSEKAEKTADNVVTNTTTDKEGNKLEMSFNNTKDIATLYFKGDTIELAGQKPASGIWYKNDKYELRGKGENVALTKNGKTLFKN